MRSSALAVVQGAEIAKQTIVKTRERASLSLISVDPPRYRPKLTQSPQARTQEFEEMSKHSFSASCREILLRGTIAPSRPNCAIPGLSAGVALSRLLGANK
jgi:hypothetical protein